jgi:hypothetical protein
MTKKLVKRGQMPNFVIMKRLLSILTPLFLSVLFISAITAKPKQDAPPGTVWLKDNLYIDAGPIRNRDYLEFLNFSKSYNWEKFFSENKELPAYGLTWDSLSVLFHNYPSDAKFLKQFVPADSVIEINTNDLMHPKAANPFRFKEYNNYPMVNISYDQAAKFCLWRSYMVNISVSIACKTAAERKKKNYSAYTFRLPSKEEWELAMKDLGGKIKLAKREFKDGAPLTLPSESSDKFTYKPFSIAEMLAEKGKAEGLSYKDIALTDIYTSQNYEGPQGWLGLRSVCEVTE